MKNMTSFAVGLAILTSLPLAGCGNNTASTLGQGNVRTIGNVTQDHTAATTTYHLSTDLSKRVARSTGVRDAIVLLRGNTAYVALDTAGTGTHNLRAGTPDYGAAAQRAPGAIGNLPTGAGNVAGHVTTGIGNVAGQVASGVGNVSGNAISGVGHAIGGPAASIGNAVGGTVSGVGNVTGHVMSGVGNVAGEAISGVGNIAGQAVSGVGNTIGNIGNNVGSSVYGVGTVNNNANAATLPGYRNYTGGNRWFNAAGYYHADQYGRVGGKANAYNAPAPTTAFTSNVQPALKQQVTDIVRQANPNIQNVYVTDHPSVFQQFLSFGRDYNNGRTAISSSFRTMMERTFPLQTAR